MKTETYICAACNTEGVRPLVRGRKPRWCLDCRDQKYVPGKKCEACGDGQVRAAERFCSRVCAQPHVGRPRSAAPRPPRLTQQELEALWRSQRTPLRQAYEERDWPAVLAAVQSDTTISPSGCWLWQRRTKAGYPVAKIGRREAAVHRVVLEAKHGADLGSQAAHHICAESMCVNPEHLQPVTHRDNVAEMLARHSYLNRIRELEAALLALDPTHPLLAVVAVA